MVAGLTLINLLLWLVFFLKFKKLFTTDNIIQDFRDKLEDLIKDAQRNTALNINVIDEKIKELRAVSAEAGRKVALLRHELDSTEKSEALQSRIKMQTPASVTVNSAEEKTRRVRGSKTVSAAKTQGGRIAKKYLQNELPAEDEAVALTGLFRENAQRTLFDSPQITVTKEGDSYGKVPILKNHVIVSDNPIKPKKSFARRVRELSDLGQSVEEIAARLERSTTEVQMVLDLQ